MANSKNLRGEVALLWMHRSERGKLLLELSLSDLGGWLNLLRVALGLERNIR